MISCKEIINMSEPVVIKNTLDWPHLNWSLEDWKSKLHQADRKYPFRHGVSRCSKKPYWERNCATVELTFEEFFTKIKNPVNKDWFYFDYKHVDQWFQQESAFKDISWSCLGLSKLPSSTVWIGSKGAHTPCHYDVYGFNVVSQLYGRKMWILFRPDLSSKLKTSRVPYEESSVYSNINFSCACSLRNSDSNISGAYYVTLEPGDILYVPKNWWHYVENLTTAISVNIWLPKKCDDISRLEESLAKSIVICFLQQSCVSDRQRLSILNPNEDDLGNEVNLEELSYCCKQSLQSCDSSNSFCIEPNKEIPKSNVHGLTQLSDKELIEILGNKCLQCNKDNRTQDKQQSFSKNCKLSENISSQNDNSLEFNEGDCCGAEPVRSGSDIETPLSREINVEDVINAFCQPDVISLVRVKLNNIILDY